MWVCRLPVHIGPAGCTGFTEILGEFVTSHWADRVVRPQDISIYTYPVGGQTTGFCPPADRTGSYGNLRRIRTSLQVLNERRFYSRY